MVNTLKSLNCWSGEFYMNFNTIFFKRGICMCVPIFVIKPPLEGVAEDACGTVNKMHSNPSAGSYVGNEMGVGGHFRFLVLHFVSRQKYYIVFSSIKTYPKTLLFFWTLKTQMFYQFAQLPILPQCLKNFFDTIYIS